MTHAKDPCEVEDITATIDMDARIDGLDKTRKIWWNRNQ